MKKDSYTAYEIVSGLVLSVIIPLLIILAVSNWEKPTQAQTGTIPDGVAQDWKIFTTPAKEFSASMPDKNMIFRRGEYTTGGTVVSETIEIGAFYRGCAMVVRIFSTDNPQAILSEETRKLSYRDAKRNSVKVRGIKAQSFINQSGDSYFEALGLISKNRLYLIQAGARKEDNAYLKHFLASINLKGMAGSTQPSDISSFSTKPPDSLSPATTSENQPEPATPSLRPVIIYAAKAVYNDRARLNRVQGTILVSVVFTTDGEVTNVKIIRGLPDGLDEQAISAVQRIRFLPAEKNGKPVSVRMSMEFSFALL